MLDYEGGRDNSPLASNGRLWRTEYRMYYRRDGRIGVATYRAYQLTAEVRKIAVKKSSQEPKRSFFDTSYDEQGRLVRTPR